VDCEGAEDTLPLSEFSCVGLRDAATLKVALPAALELNELNPVLDALSDFDKTKLSYGVNEEIAETLDTIDGEELRLADNEMVILGDSPGDRLAKGVRVGQSV
jgi:hypothetical protein